MRKQLLGINILSQFLEKYAWQLDVIRVLIVYDSSDFIALNSYAYAHHMALNRKEGLNAHDCACTHVG